MTPEEKIQSLINAANTITGESRTDLTACIQDLKNAYDEKDNLNIISKPSSVLLLSNGYGFNANQTDAIGKMLNSDFTNFIYNLSSASTTARVIVKFKVTDSSDFTEYRGVFGDDMTGEPAIYSIGAYLYPPNNISVRIRQNDNTGVDVGVSGIILNNWHYIVAHIDKINSVFTASLFANDGTLISSRNKTFTSVYNHTSGWTKLGGISTNGNLRGELNLSEICYLIDETPVWGKLNNKTTTMGIPT